LATDFYIERVTAFGKGKQDAIVELANGLNIIHGISDTGKSCVLLCIDYIFGGRTQPFNKKQTGYTHVEVNVKTNEGDVTFTRELGKHIIFVKSTDPNIESGDYDREHKSDTGRGAISAVLLQLIGIEDEHRIIYNKDYVKKRLTWRSFSHMLVINEDDVHTKKPILLPKSEVNSTYFLSALLFLLTGNDFSEVNEQEERRIRNAKKDELIKQINSEIAKYSEKTKELKSRLSKYNDSDVIAHANKMVAQLTEVRESINAANERGRQLLGQIMEARQEITDSDFQISRLRSLRQHLLNDIKRLSMIADGKAIMDEIAPIIEECPVCGGHLKSEADGDVIAAANADLRNAVEALKGWEHALDEQKERQTAAESELTRLEKEKEEIDRLVSERLRPQEFEIDKVLKNFKSVSQIQAEIDLVAFFTTERQRELHAYQNDVYIHDYHVKEKFKDIPGFYDGLNECIWHTFNACRYENLNSVDFYLEKFEVFVNGVDKGESHGKGYRAFINTVLALAFRKYLHDRAKYRTGLFVVDSPLLTLKQGVDDVAEESMRTGLFRYLLENQDDGQVIVIENDIPDLNYADYGVKPIEFMGGKKPGRYGFLYLDGQY